MAGEGRRLTEEDGRRALRDHAAEKGAEGRAKAGGRVGWAELSALLEDRSVVRYPTRVVFDDRPLEPGEFAWARPLGERPSDGFEIVVHPYFRDREEDLPLLVAYHLVAVNYGEIATREEAEAFGAALLGLEVDDYYERVCRLADELAAATGGAPCR